MGCGGIPTPCNGVSEFGASDSPCNASTMSEWGARDERAAAKAACSYRKVNTCLNKKGIIPHIG